MPNLLKKKFQGFSQALCLILISSFCVSSYAQEQQPFNDWLADLHSEALAAG